MTAKSKSAIVLLSGGLDSMVVAGLAREAGYDVIALTIDYNQRHRIELDSAATIAAHLEATEHIVLPLDLTRFGGSALTADIAVPKEGVEENAIPITYVPARNTVFLSYALAWAETLGSFDIFMGVNALDYSGYPDCRPEYIQAYEHMANLATKAGVEGRQRLTIHAPLMAMNKAQIIQAGVGLGVDYALTSSCYDPGPQGQPCGACASCQLRAKGFSAAALDDPLYTRFGMPQPPAV
jgi:7-cyano-7-deazaguanine synthase